MAARDFFRALAIQEVDLPALVSHAVTDAQIDSLQVTTPGQPSSIGYLHTSPEYGMKRLLAAGSPDIYQLGKVYRAGETGRLHQPEFTMIEWYRRGIALDDMAAETCALIRALAASAGDPPPVGRALRYADAFKEHVGIDPINASTSALQRQATSLLGAGVPELGDDRDAWLDLLLSQVLAPRLPREALTVLSHYPASQAALARLHPQDNRLAERFEIFWRGVELANGYRELRDPDEQRARFERDRSIRRKQGRQDVEPDPALLAALSAGLPDCCGVAVGFDRLLMLALNRDRLTDVISFPLRT